MARVTVHIDAEGCIAAANCVGIAPKVFQIGAEPYVELVDAEGAVAGTRCTYEATPELMEALDEAVESCPTRAISLTHE